MPETARWSALGVALGVAVFGVLAESWRRASRELALALSTTQTTVATTRIDSAEPSEVLT
jgi:hypothetical protein